MTLVLLGIGLLLLAGAAVAGILLYNNRNFGKTAAVANTSPSPPTNSKTEENTQELKERLANVERQLNEQKNAKTNSSQTPITKPTQTDSTITQTTATATVAQSNDGYLSLRSAPSAQMGTQILKIPSGSTVELEDCQRNFVVVDNHRGRWCMISYGGYTGWAFDAWLIY